MSKTDISWTDDVWNPVVGCSMVSEGCQNCYAMKFAHRGLASQHRGLTTASKHGPRWTGEVRTVPDMLSAPLKWKKPRVVFVNSMSDLFHDKVPFEYIAAVFGVMAACHQHTFIVLTKRDPRKWFEWVEGNDRCSAEEFVQREAHRLLPVEFPLHPIKQTFRRYPWPLPNVALGVSCENQAAADERIPWLLQTPAATRIVSAEPLLGETDLQSYFRVKLQPGNIWADCCCDEIDPSDRPCVVCEARMGLDGVIVGGESGPNSRPCSVEWIRSIARQCKEASVKCFCKQLGARPYAERSESWCETHPNNMHLVQSTHEGLYDVGLNLKDRKGADMSEWPSDLRIRELPWRNT